MKKQNKSSISFTVIEIDEKTNEPKLSQISQEEYAERLKSGAETLPFKTVTDENAEHTAKQTVMTKVFGFDDRDAVSARQKAFKTILVALFFAVVLGVLCWTAYNDFFSEDKTLPTKEYLYEVFSARWYFIFFAIFSVFLCYLFKGLKLSVVSKKIRGRYNFGVCMSTGLFGLYYNYATPFGMGSQPFEIYYLSKRGFTGGEAASATLSTFILNRIAFVICGAVSIILFFGNVLKIPDVMITAIPTVITSIAILGLFLTATIPLFTVLFSFNPKIGAKLVDFVFFLGKKLKLVKNPAETKAKTLNGLTSNSNCLRQLSKMPALFSIETLLSFAEQFANCSIAYFTLKFFGFKWTNGNMLLEWLQVMQLCFILYSAVSFIPTPGNSGAADLSFYLLFDTGLGLSAAGSYGGLAFPAMLLWRFLSFYSFIIIGFLFTAVEKRKAKRLNS